MASTSKIIANSIAEQLRQCQNCHISTEELKATHKKPLSCAGCKRVHYCGADCQRSDWSYHKLLCRANLDAKAARQAGKEWAPAAPNAREKLHMAEVEQRLKPWIQAYRPLILQSVVHALEVYHTDPDNCFTRVLFLKLVPTFGKRNKKSPINQSFMIVTAESVLIDELDKYLPPEQQEGMQLDHYIQKSREIREEGGLGLLLTVIFVPLVGVGHVTPSGISSKAEINPPGYVYKPNWKEELQRKVLMGVTI